MEFANELSLGAGNVTSYGRTVYAISLTKSALSLERSIGMHLLVKPGPTDSQLASQRVAFLSYAYLENIALDEYKGGGTEADNAKLEEVTARLQAEGVAMSKDAAQRDPDYVPPPAKPETMISEIGRLSTTDESARAELAEKGITPENWWAVNTLRFDGYREIESGLADAAVSEASRIADDAQRDAFITGAAVVLALLAAFILAGMVARQMSKSMRQLRNAAFGIAEQRLPMLVDQLSRTDPGRVDTRVAPIPITSTDEIGEVARAFDQVHREAVRLAAEQALLRGNINAIFTNLSRRNQSLIEGQLTLITDLENNEADPDQLENLFRLDHLATRMRRNGENLLVLAGEEPGRRWDQPVPLVDVLRAASSEVEQYERIELSGVPDAEIHGRAVTDLVHLLAELLENATTFSSPQTKVRVTATRLPDGRVMIEIHDKGIGLTAEDFADINHKLANRRPWTPRSRSAWACSWSAGCRTGTASASSCAPRASRPAPPRWSCCRTRSPTVVAASSRWTATSSPSRRSSPSRTTPVRTSARSRCAPPRSWASTTAATRRSRTTSASWTPSAVP